MKIVVTASADLDLRPPVADKLRRIPIACLHHARLQLRPPAGHFYVSLQNVASRLEEMLRRMEELKPPFGPGAAPEALGSLIEAMEVLLHAVMGHLEACQAILFSLFASNREALAAQSVKQFIRETKAYREQVAMIVNAVKHRGTRIGSALMYDASAYAPGYFVESELEDGVIGPDRNIHHGGDTAISLFRDLKLHLCQLFFVGASVGKAVGAITPLEDGTDDEQVSKRGYRMRELVRKVSLLPEIVFPDEVYLPFPLIRLRSADDFGTEAEFSLNPRRVSTFGRFEMKVTYGGDSVAKTFKVPYLRPGWQEDLAKRSRR